MGEAQGVTGDGARDTGIESEQAVFDVLESERCRRILRATRGEPRTATDLASALDIPVSTVYRKLDALVDAGLVTESTRIRHHGNHCVQYECVVGGISVDFDTGAVELQFTDPATGLGGDTSPE
jgi:DNA-binding transcriptional ArsR family regulator